MTPDHDDLRAQVSAYFDGELPPADEPAVIDHLATCEECQGLLGDTVGLHAAVQREPVRAAAPIAPAAPRRRLWLAGGALAAAAALVLVWQTTRPKPRPDAVAIALAPKRGVEVRFTGGPFAAHREYEVARSGAGGEPIGLAVLADLEKRGQRAVLAAALASSGEAARARDLLDAMPESGDVLNDRAGVALVLGDAAGALALTDRAIAAGATAAVWNRALALRDLGLPLAAAAAFERVTDDWGAEAAGRAKALREAEARRVAAIVDVDARARAMIGEQGPPLTAADLATAQMRTRWAFHDALRTAPDRARVLALAPLAEAQDAIYEPGARAALDHVAGLDFTVRARYANRYAAVALGTASPDESAALLRELIAAGPDVADLALGVAVLTLGGDERAATLGRMLAGATDPWFVRLRTTEQLATLDADAAERAARAAIEGCGQRIDYRCAVLKSELAYLLSRRAAFAEALVWYRGALADLHGTGSLDRERNTLVAIADEQRRLSLLSEARATLEDAAQRVPVDAPCLTARLIAFNLADVARQRGDLAGARAAVPALAACDAPAHLQAAGLVLDLALESGLEGDRAIARTWIDAVRAGYPLEAAALDARLLSATDPAAARAALAPLMPRVGEGDPGLAPYAYTTLLRVDGALADWDGAVAAAEAELGLGHAACRAVVSVDDGVVTVAVRASVRGTFGAVARTPDLAAAGYHVPADLVDRLRTCGIVGLIARPPLHGRDDLLPADLPWAFGSASGAGVSVIAPPRAVIVADTEPPAADIRLPRLATTDFPDGATAITGTAATPSRVLAELATATYAELHAHGIANLAEPGTSFLALSPDRDGAWQLTAAAVAKTKLAAHPVIVLGACKAAATTPRWDARWSLPDAFLTAGARAVIAADVDLPDREAAALFAKLRARLAAGEAPAAALAAERTAAIAAGQSWAAHLMVFE